ncbi:hypothetical protein [Pelomonas sp. Root1444]|uniref:hypothetical protein n=1 Tax=Pelomonas sp. Root1444 TaxID=1736464 RepID=UPI000B2CCF60|nr:hypothetical protein [Pelomonas sp. Root1444]
MRQSASVLSKWNTRFLSTFSGRITVAIFFTLALYAIARWLPEALGPLVFIGISAAAVISLVRRLRVLLPAVKIRGVRRFGRFLRATRIVSAIHPAVEALQLIVVLLALLVMCYLMLFKDKQSLSWIANTLVGLLIAAAAADIPFQLRAVTKLAWSQTLGKLALGSISALAIILATHEARDMVHDLTQSDPNNFPDFQSLAVFILTPAYYVGIVAGVLCVWAALNLFLGAFSLYMAIFASLIPSFKNKKKAFWGYRLAYGKRPPRDYKPEEFNWDGVLFFMRNIGIVLAVSLGGSALRQFGSDHHAVIDRGLKAALVGLDFRPGALCGSVLETAPAAYLEKSALLVATKAPEGITFARRECATPGR